MSRRNVKITNSLALVSLLIMPASTIAQRSSRNPDQLLAHQVHVSRETPYGKVDVAENDSVAAEAVANDIASAKNALIIWASIPLAKNTQTVTDFTWNQTAIVTIFSAGLPQAGVFEARWFGPDNQLYTTTVESFRFDGGNGPRTVSTSLKFPPSENLSQESPLVGVWRVDLFIDGQTINSQQIQFSNMEDDAR